VLLYYYIIYWKCLKAFRVSLPFIIWIFKPDITPYTSWVQVG